MSTDHRIHVHPVLDICETRKFDFKWNGKNQIAREGETIASALIANGIQVFGHHPRDGSPQGLFCANGQCSQCLVIADGVPVKACMERVRPGMRIHALDALPGLSGSVEKIRTAAIPEREIPILILGGGPAGLSAAMALGEHGVRTLLVDDKHQLGGKLVLQTHRFFGSRKAVFAGERGIDIARMLSERIGKLDSVEVWLESTALAVFSDKKIGVLKNGGQYTLVKPEILLVATGAREKFISFRGNTLPGVMGAGAFQTLMNRDLVRPGSRVFVVGGGNVGLITAYHALQAGIEVAGVCEVMPEFSGYHVHQDKLARYGVPLFPSHTVIQADGQGSVGSVKIGSVDSSFAVIPGTQKSIACDCLLVAVGLSPVDEFIHKAEKYRLPVFSAGDAAEIAEASAAMVSGKIGALKIMDFLNKTETRLEDDLRTLEILKSKPGKTIDRQTVTPKKGVYPVIHCRQEIPCDPCAAICPMGLIKIPDQEIRKVPVFESSAGSCSGCRRCLAICPGLAITLVDYRKNPHQPVVSVAYEYSTEQLIPGDHYPAFDNLGGYLGEAELLKVSKIRNFSKTVILELLAKPDIAERITAVRLTAREKIAPEQSETIFPDTDEIICRCERVSKVEIISIIKAGCRDINEIKAVTRAGMGACGGRTCENLIMQVFKELGIAENEIIHHTVRPLFSETAIGTLAGIKKPKG